MNKDVRFKIARISAHLTQQELADAAKVRESLIARIESGRATPPDCDTAERIARALGKHPWEVGI